MFCTGSIEAQWKKPLFVIRNKKYQMWLRIRKWNKFHVILDKNNRPCTQMIKDHALYLVFIKVSHMTHSFKTY